MAFSRRKQKNRRRLTPVQAGLLLVLLIMILPLVLHRFTRFDVQEPAAAAVVESNTGAGPEEALAEIYSKNDVRGVQPVNARELDETYGISKKLYINAWCRTTDGTYGIADVFIFQKDENTADQLQVALDQVKNNAIVAAQHYDVYNAMENAEEGQIFEVGDYMCLVMIENNDQARGILETCLAVS